MGELIKLLGKLFYGLASIIDGSFLSELGIAAKLRELAKTMYDGVGNVSEKIGDITGMSRTDALTLLNSALTAVSSTFPTNNNQSELQKNITAILILMGYFLDTSGHSEKMSSLKSLQSDDFIPVVGKLISRIETIKTSKTPWGTLNQENLSGVAYNGIDEIWKECCVMEITLKDNGGSLKVHNLDNMYNAYKFIGALSGFGALGLSMTNFVLTLRGSSSSGETPSPSTAPYFNNMPTSSPTTQPYNDTVGLGIAGAIPIRFVSDAVTKMVFREESTIAQFLEKILSSLEKGLDIAKTRKQETVPKEIPAGLIVLLEKENMSDGLKKAAKLVGDYNDYNSSFVNAKISSANNAATKAEQERIAAIAEKIKAESERDAAKSEKIKVENEMDEANRNISSLKIRVDELSADNLLKQANIENISKSLVGMEAELNKEKKYKEDNGVIIESLVTMIFEDCFKECKLTLNQKKIFIDKLKNCLPEPRSSTIAAILNKLEDNCLEHKDDILATVFAPPTLSRVSSAPLAAKEASLPLETPTPPIGLPLMPNLTPV
jgi:hypothetical protein